MSDKVYRQRLIDQATEPLSLDPGSRQAFRDRLEKLVDGPVWPVNHWYSDQDFCQAYATACHWKDEADELRALVQNIHRNTGNGERLDLHQATWILQKIHVLTAVDTAAEKVSDE